MMEYSEFPAPNIEVTTKRSTGCSCDKKIAAVAERRHRKTIVPVAVRSYHGGLAPEEQCQIPATDAFKIGDLKSLNSNATV
jgi:hypothetical protein